jgi:hypothetical protein
LEVVVSQMGREVLMVCQTVEQESSYFQMKGEYVAWTCWIVGAVIPEAQWFQLCQVLWAQMQYFHPSDFHWKPLKKYVVTHLSPT